MRASTTPNHPQKGSREPALPIVHFAKDLPPKTNAQRQRSRTIGAVAIGATSDYGRWHRLDYRRSGEDLRMLLAAASGTRYRTAKYSNSGRDSYTEASRVTVHERARQEIRATMTTTVELSMYPFKDTFREMIKDFVAKLNAVENLKVTTGPTSTVVVGEHAHVMQTLTELLEWSHAQHGKAVFVAKILPGYEAG